MSNSTNDDRISVASLWAAGVFLLAFLGSLWVVFGPMSQHIDRLNKANWRSGTAKVTWVSNVAGEATQPYVFVQLSYTDYSGKPQTSPQVEMPAPLKQSQTVPIYVGRLGGLRVPTSLDMTYGDDPMYNWIDSGAGPLVAMAFAAGPALLAFLITAGWLTPPSRRRGVED